VRILIINTDYPVFLRHLYAQHAGLDRAAYAQQMTARNASFFGVFDAYSQGFRANGHAAEEVHANNGAMQRAWAEERGLRPPSTSRALARLRFHARRVINRLLPRPFDTRNVLRSPFAIEPWQLVDILDAQVRAFRPDVILNQSVSEVGSDVLEPMRRHVRLVVGQIASPLPDDEDYRAYDLMVSSLPNYVARFGELGKPAELNRLGFDARVLDAVGEVERDVAVSFVGSLSPAHPDRARLVEFIAERTELDIWGNGLDQFPPSSAIHRRDHGEAWGLDMFRALARSKITLNCHIGIAGHYANNMRLYEATGMGSLLITDRKANIAEMFEPGEEIVTYDSFEECLALIERYRHDETARARIAAAGQRRTLAEHTYVRRAGELAALFQRELQKGRD
jgi:hypothetical protein